MNRNKRNKNIAEDMFDEFDSEFGFRDDPKARPKTRSGADPDDAWERKTRTSGRKSGVSVVLIEVILVVAALFVVTAVVGIKTLSLLKYEKSSIASAAVSTTVEKTEKETDDSDEELETDESTRKEAETVLEEDEEVFPEDEAVEENDDVEEDEPSGGDTGYVFKFEGTSSSVKSEEKAKSKETAKSKENTKSEEQPKAEEGSKNDESSDAKDEVVFRFDLGKTAVETTPAAPAEETTDDAKASTDSVSVFGQFFGAPTEPLKKGDKNSDVQKVQEMLIKLGYLGGTADGSYGAKTEDAVKKYQTEKQLSVTGIVDSSTYNQLKSDSAAK